MSTTITPIHTATPTTITTITRPRVQIGLRVLWLAVTALGLALFSIGIVRYYSVLATSPRYTPYEPVLASLGLTMPFLAGYLVFFDILAVVICTGIALVIFVRRNDDWLALAISQTIFFLGFSFSFAIAQLQPLVGAIVIVVGFLMLILPMTVFPSGMFAPRWMKLLALICVPYFIATIPVQAIALDLRASNTVPDGYGIAVGGMFVIFAVGIIGLINRYQRYATIAQRQQMKFVIFGIVCAFAFDLIVWASGILPMLAHPYVAPERAVYTLPSLLALLFAKPIDFLSLVTIPIGFAFAISRSRLWDIDLVINRSLVYGSATGTIGIVFIGAALTLMRLLGEENASIAIVLSVVVAGGLFNPARLRARQLIDRRVYGLRFNLDQLQGANQKPIMRGSVFEGQEIGRYAIGDLIGKGGMGAIYSASDGTHTVAVKFVPQTEAEHRQRFEREARITRQLQHPNIVHVMEYGAIAEYDYMIMDYIQGIDLQRHLKQVTPTLMETCQIVGQLADALDYAHAQHLVHRDLKPSNVMLSPKSDGTWHVTLLDFGIARVETQTRLTGTGAIGTIDYMAPEQIQEARAVDQRADIYALGILTYEMLSGGRPFVGTPAQVMFAHLQQPPPNLHSTHPHISQAISAAIVRAMSKEPDDRYSTAGDFASAVADTAERN